MPFKISVVTATLNRCQLLREAIESVAAQGLDDVQHIVVDALSSDGTCEMLASYPHLEVVREADRGLYEAWNKGVARARGDLIVILNSDDLIPPGAFAAARSAFCAAPDLDILSGPAEFIDASGSGLLSRIDDPRILSLREQDVGPGIPITNARYLTPRLCRRVGPFNQDFPLVADRDFLLRVLLARPRHVVQAAPLYRYRLHDGSLTLGGISPSLRLADDCLAAARTGLATAQSGAARAAYARWHAWASAYRAGLALRQGELRAGLGLAAQAFELEAVWPLRLPAQIWRHASERGARRGTLSAG